VCLFLHLVFAPLRLCRLFWGSQGIIGFSANLYSTPAGWDLEHVLYWPSGSLAFTSYNIVLRLHSATKKSHVNSTYIMICLWTRMYGRYYMVRAKIYSRQIRKSGGGKNQPSNSEFAVARMYVTVWVQQDMCVVCGGNGKVLVSRRVRHPCLLKMPSSLNASFLFTVV
jgi:hypothetical protein